MSSQKGFDFGLLRALEWARELRTLNKDIYREASTTQKMAPAYDRLDHIHKAAKEIMHAIMTQADWCDSAEFAAPGTRERVEVLLLRVSKLSEGTAQTKPPRFITEDELKEAMWTSAECTRIAVDVEKGAGRVY